MSDESPNPAEELRLCRERIAALEAQATELQKLAGELVTTQAQLTALLHNASDAIIVFDREGRVREFNATAQTVFGYRDTEVIGEFVDHLIPCPAEYRRNVAWCIREACRAATPDRPRVQITGKRRSGVDVKLDVAFSQIVDDTVLFEDDSPGSETSTDEYRAEIALCVLRDVTVEHMVKRNFDEHRAMLQRTIDSLNASNRAKEDFLANMSHEIRTPMTAILGYTDLLLDADADPSDLDRHVRTIRRNGEHLLSIINDILDISKIDSGKMEVECIRFSPVELLEEVRALMEVRARAKELSLTLEFDGPVPRTIQSDPTRLRQVLINLIGNAIKFTEEHGVRISTRLVGDNPDHLLQLDVIDSGIGMTAEQVRKLFQPFTQADETMSRKYGGTGLGLAISKRLAQRLSGDVVIAWTEIGKGTCFRATIHAGPLEGVALVDGATEIASQAVSASDGAERAPVQADIEGRRVLLAEDGPDNQRLISHILRKAGARVEVVDNGQKAFDSALEQAAANAPFDAILMDMQMPEKDGYTATRELREQGYDRPIIALTAHAMASDRQKCIDAGCDEYTTKPVNRKALVALISEQIHRYATVTA